MKDWAKQFYASDAWHKCRESYLAHVGYVCERCQASEKYVPAEIVHHKKYLAPRNINNPDVSLNFENLEALCQDCHNKEHASKRRARYKFDENGRLSPPIQGQFLIPKAPSPIQQTNPAIRAKGV